MWTGKPGANGYGQFKIHGRTLPAHRAAFAIAHGYVPAGMCVLHTCDVKMCVRPDHLFLGTQATNIADKIAKGRKVVSPGERNGMSKLTEKQIAAIRAMRGKALQREIAAQFGVTQAHVSNIQRGKRW